MSGPVDVLATLLKHADLHRSLAGSDAYSAQEAPKLEAAYSAVLELVETSKKTIKAFEDLGNARGVIANFQARQECEYALSAQKELIAKFWSTP